MHKAKWDIPWCILFAGDIELVDESQT
jgi:hypothetical protein